MKHTTKIVFDLIILSSAVLVGSVFRLSQPDLPSDTTSPAPPAVVQSAASGASVPTVAFAKEQSNKDGAATPTKAATSPAATPAPLSKHMALKQSIAHEYQYRLFAAPNDPGYASDWALQKVQAPAAWNIATGNGQTVVAVIDSGFALAHQDLADRWYINAGESGMTQSGDRCWTGTPQDKQTNNCDDDNNSYVDDWRGWSFAYENNNPQTGLHSPAGDGVTHGTKVAGFVGAATNNGIGMAAINWNTRIMPLQALDDDGVGYTSDVAGAVYYAVDNGAQVINLSLGSYALDTVMRTAINYATQHNVLVVAAAGNCGDGGSDCSGVPAGTIAYPAAYPDVIAVGASTSSDTRASFSDYGAGLDVVAPGYGVPVSTSWSAGNQTSLYASHLFGTSFSSPQVASLASLILSIRPNATVSELTGLIEATATKVPDMNGLNYTQQLGHGVINAYAALTITSSLNNVTPLSPTLFQAGTFQAEHIAPAGSALGSGCQVAADSVCTIQLLNTTNGYKRYLPYAATSSGDAGWSWSADMLDSGSWEIRAVSGNLISTTPYQLLKF